MLRLLFRLSSFRRRSFRRCLEFMRTPVDFDNDSALSVDTGSGAYFVDFLESILLVHQHKLGERVDDWLYKQIVSIDGVLLGIEVGRNDNDNGEVDTFVLAELCVEKRTRNVRKHSQLFRVVVNCSVDANEPNWKQLTHDWCHDGSLTTVASSTRRCVSYPQTAHSNLICPQLISTGTEVE